MAMLCVLGWLLPGLAPVWLLLPEYVRQQVRNQLALPQIHQPSLRNWKTARRIRSPCLRGIWVSRSLRLKGG